MLVRYRHIAFAGCLGVLRLMVLVLAKLVCFRLVLVVLVVFRGWYLLFGVDAWFGGFVGSWFWVFGFAWLLVLGVCYCVLLFCLVGWFTFRLRTTGDEFAGTRIEFGGSLALRCGFLDGFGDLVGFKVGVWFGFWVFVV